MKFYRLSQIIGDKSDEALIPISRSEVWRKVKIGQFPSPIKLSPRVTVWRSADIENYIKNMGEKNDNF